jgi:thymidylate synthase
MRRFKSIDEALVGILQDVLNHGSIASPRDRKTQEILGYSFRIDKPRARKVYNPEREWDEALAVGELCWHMSASDDVDFISYYADAWEKFSEDEKRITGSCYGKKIFDDGCEGSKWTRLKEELRSDQESRRGVIDIFDSCEDLGTDRPDVPCVTSLQFILRDGQLNCINTMRSNDIIWGLCYDMFFVSTLQEILSLELGVDLGWYQQNAGSIHVYERHYDIAEDIVSFGIPKNTPPMPPMTKVSSISEFLEVEKRLRNGDASGVKKSSSLPKFWRDLSQPLIRKYQARHDKSDDQTRITATS